ncbi:MAG: indole-3-glycerol-phosphate synthase [Limnochordaceae bacterium]|nr:indole-3-glycerol-phosphate synthase [Limnochordaceae bacterium]
MVQAKRAARPATLQDSQAGTRPVRRSLVAALRRARQALQAYRQALEAGGTGTTVPSPGAGLPIVAEVKRRSPSAGDIAPSADAVSRALAYQRAGAAAVSVLADEAFFGGSPADVAAVARAVAVPVLFKDIVVEPWQIDLARQVGASAVLLIVAALEEDRLSSLLRYARDRGLETVVEVHTQRELERAMALDGVSVLGVNNRDLATFEVDTRTALRLLPQVPEGIVRLAESGYAAPEAVAEAWGAGADGVLVGEALMRSEDPGAFFEGALRAWARRA